MLRVYTIIIILLGLMWMSACTPADDGSLPTLAVLPSVTPTSTPTETATATPTWTPSATFTPTHTPTATLTLTPSPTLSATPSRTPEPSPTPTHTLTFTPLPPTATFTPLPALEPSIFSFSANTTVVAPGGQVTLTWQGEGDSARIERLDPSGVIQVTTAVPVSGSSAFSVPATGAQVIFRLVVTRGEAQTSLAQTITLAQSCAIAYFFNAPPTLPCAQSSPVNAPASFQVFQRGWMFRLQYGGFDRVCGIQNDRNLYSCFAYSAYTDTPPASPPAGTFPPAPEFQQTFYGRLAIGGLWYDIIGWGTGITNTTPLVVQPDTEGRLYINTPLGIYRFDGQLTNGAVMEIVPVTP